MTIFLDAAWGAVAAADIRGATSLASRAAELALGLGGLVEDHAQAQLLRVQVIAGLAGAHAAAASRLRAFVSADSLLDPVVAVYAQTFIWVEEFDEAERILAAGLRRARETSALTTSPLLLGTQCELATWRGSEHEHLVDGSTPRR